MSNDPQLSWTSFPLVERWQTSIILFAFVFVLAFAIWYLVVIPLNIPVGFYMLGFALFFIEMAPWFVPTTYEFYEDKLLVRYPFFKTEKPWSNFGCFYADARGVMLSTFIRPRRLDRFRGQSVRFSPDGPTRQQVMDFVATKIERKY